MVDAILAAVGGRVDKTDSAAFEDGGAIGIRGSGLG